MAVFLLYRLVLHQRLHLLLTINEQSEKLTVADVRFARMTLSFGPITQAYTSRVVLDPTQRTIDARATDGPFSHLVSHWRFEPEGGGARIHFDIDFKISNPLIAAVAEPAFAAKQREIMDAFVTEAERRYGGA